MSKTAFIFPGQGAQYVGMGQDFYEKIPVCKKVIDKASEVTGLDLPALCFEENEKLKMENQKLKKSLDRKTLGIIANLKLT